RVGGPESTPESPPESNTAELRAAADRLRPLAERCGSDLARFRDELALGVEVDTWDPRADRVSLLTLHASKGLEFPVVFIVGCEDGLLPLRWPGSEDRKSTRLNSSHVKISYAVFCLKKKK